MLLLKFGPNLKEALEMLDKICQCLALDEKQVAMLGEVTQELENLRINEKKQRRIEHFFLKNMEFYLKVFFFVLITFQLKH